MKVALGAEGACIKTPWAQPRKKTSRARPREQFAQLVAGVAFVSALRSPRFTFEPTAPWSQSVQFQPLVVSPNARSLIFNPAVAQRGHHAAAVDALEAAARHRGGDPGCSPSGWVLPLRRRLFFVIFGPPCCSLSLFDLFLVPWLVGRHTCAPGWWLCLFCGRLSREISPLSAVPRTRVSNVFF